MLLDLLKHVQQIGSQVPARVKTSNASVKGLNSVFAGRYFGTGSEMTCRVARKMA